MIASVPRSVYYHRLKAGKRPDRHLEVKEQIAKIFYQHKGRYGYRRVHLALRNDACYLNHKTVQRLMSQLGLKASTPPKRYRSYRGAIGKAAPNLLARQFSAKQVNQKWATDVTEFNVHGHKVYLSPVIDLCNQEIVSHTIADRPQMSMVMQMLDQALQRLHPQDQPLLHSDQGWQYQMQVYQEALQDRGVIQSMSRKGNCLDNAIMEGWFGILKTEFFHGKSFESIESFKRELKEYIDYYNHDRIKQKLGGLSPVQYRNQELMLS